jgi:hypothetical protein
MTRRNDDYICAVMKPDPNIKSSLYLIGSNTTSNDYPKFSENTVRGNLEKPLIMLGATNTTSTNTGAMMLGGGDDPTKGLSLRKY